MAQARTRRAAPMARTLLTLASVLTLVVTGYGWYAYRDLSTGLTHSQALDGPGHSGQTTDQGPMNILVMGLDSRLDQNGNPLPKAVLDQLHAGDSSNGGYNSNVLMVLHVPGGTGHASAISVPRDDYVRLPGEPDGVSKAKIKEGYGLAKDAAEKKLRAQGVRDPLTLEQQGREAGRRQTIQTVQSFLGISINHFVEVTLVGFYDLAKALGSVTVCLDGPTQDSFSGAKFVKGRQQLDAAQALAFVRQRRDYVHPELNFTDLDRARRQQAFLASVAYELKSAGTFANPSRLSGLIDVAKQDVVIDSSFDLLSLLEQAPQLVDGNLTFTTLPVKSFENVGGQDVNIVDTEQIRSVVRSLINPDDAPAPAAPPSAVLPTAKVDVVNGTGRDGLAGTVLTGLVARGMTRGTASTDRRTTSSSVLSYSPDALDAATALAGVLDGVRTRPDPNLTAGRIRLVLGTDFTLPANFTSSPAGTASTDGNGGPSSGAQAPPAVPTSSIKAGGIPCVK